jgi:serine/threonine-protein kinase
MTDLSRRRVVQGTGAAIAATALAGCGSEGGGGGGGDEVPQEIADHLDGANGYDSSIEDRTGQDEVTVEVGAGNGLSFAPAAVRVDAGTTVVWEWTGQASPHNVASTDDSATDFESELYSEAGQTFEQTFDQAGIQLYVCEPHQAQGMKGAVDVVES